jgi:hypothetical protein
MQCRCPAASTVRISLAAYRLGLVHMAMRPCADAGCASLLLAGSACAHHTCTILLSQVVP